jgi:cobalamin biosynthetic protein CobC
MVHGGRVRAAEAAFPDAQRPWIDLSTGLNPHGWRGATGGVDWHALPDSEDLAGLEAAAAAHFGAAPGNVCALPGTEIGLRLLGTLPLPHPVSIVRPGYATHLEAFPGAVAIGADQLDEAAARGGSLLLANPNNPDGRLLTIARLIDLAARLRQSGGLLIVDEAFVDAVDGAGLSPHLDDQLRGHVIVLRSFGKFFGLGGLRLGFAVAGEQWLGPLRQRLGSWPVSAAAIAMGTAAYRDGAWIAATRARLAADAARLDTLLAAHGLIAVGACPLFRLVETNEAALLFRRLIGRGLLTRPFADAPRWLRIGLPGDEAAWERLGRALADG